MTRRSLALALLLTAAFTLGGCDRPYPVYADVTGSEKLPLSGEIGVLGVTSRTLRFGERQIPKGSQVKVLETWLIRRKPGRPPSYRVSGLYDPAKEAEGFVLPTRAVDVYYLAQIAPDYIASVPVPARFFKPTGKR